MYQFPTHKILFTWLLCFAALAQGQNETIGDLIQKTPQCALQCFLNAVPSPSCLTGVGQLSSCVCTNNTQLADLTRCVQLSCEISDQIQSKSLLDQLCQAFPQESQQMTLLLTSLLTIALSVPSIALRWWARCRSSQLGWDDYTALVASLLVVILAALQLKGTTLGFGRHVWDVDPTSGIPLLQIYWVSQQIYAVVQLLISVSILALYSRVFPVRWFQVTVWVGIITFFAQDIVFASLITLRCLPVQAIWDIRVSGRCLNLNLIGLVGAIMHISEHFILLLLPLPELWRLKLSRRKKVQLLLVFILGSFSCVTSVIRLRYVATFAPTVDASWDTVPVVVWSLIEDLSAVICINLPPCRHLIGQLFPHRLLTTTRATYTTQSRAMESKLSGPRDFDNQSDQYGSFVTVESGGRPGFIKGYMSGSTSWLDAPVPSTATRNSKFNTKSMVLVRDMRARSEALKGVNIARSYSVASARTLNVEIDHSELGLSEIFQVREAENRGSNKGHSRSPGTVDG